MSDLEPRRRRRPYSYTDWRADGFRGRPPWRRGYRPAYFALSLGLVALLVAIVVIGASR